MALVDTTIVVDPSNVIVSTAEGQSVTVSPAVLDITVAGAVGIRGPKGEQGDQGIQGPQGDPGPNSIGGAPIDASGLEINDVLQYTGTAWSNRPQVNLTDGGNF